MHAGRVKVLAPSTERYDSLGALDDERFDFGILKDMVGFMGEIPRFVVDPAVMGLLATDQAMMSIGDMLACGVLQLPFPACVVEFPANLATYSVLIRVAERPSGRTCWLCSALAYRGKDEGEDYAIAFPCSVEFYVELPPGALEDTENLAPPQPDLQYEVRAERFLISDATAAATMLDDARPLALQRCFAAYLAAMLLPQTVGLKRELATVKPSFNRSRAIKGRSPVPVHTVIKLGRYGTADGASKAIGEGAGVEVHLRRAHKRRVVYGPGRADRAWRFFPAQVVGYLPDGRKPSLPEMLATRATKPYVLK